MRKILLPLVLLSTLIFTVGCGANRIGAAAYQNNMAAFTSEMKTPHSLTLYDAKAVTSKGKFEYFKKLYDDVRVSKPNDALMLESYALATCLDCTKYIMQYRSNDYIMDTTGYIGRFLTSSNWNYIGDYRPEPYYAQQNEAVRIYLLKRGIRPKNIADFYNHFYARYKVSLLHMEGFDADKKLWDQAVAGNTIDSYKGYLNSTRHAYYAEEANTQLTMLEKVVPEYELAVKNGIPALEEFVAKYPEYTPAQVTLGEMKKQAEQEQTYIDNINKFLAAEDYAGLGKYVEATPEAKFYIPSPEIRLLFFGPEKMKIGNIKKLIDSHIGQPIIISKVKRSDTGYKDFDMDEIAILKGWKFSDTLIAAMMDVTTSIEKENQRRAEQNAMLAKQEAMLNAMQNIKAGGTTTIIQQNETVGQAVGKSLANSAADQAGKVMVNKLINSLF
jgi:hypothetical protein